MMCWASSPALIAGRDEEPLSRASPKRSRKSNPNISRCLAGAVNVVLTLIAVGEVGRLSHLPAALALRHASPTTGWQAAAGGMPAGRADRSRNGFRRSLFLKLQRETERLAMARSIAQQALDGRKFDGARPFGHYPGVTPERQALG